MRIDRVPKKRSRGDPRAIDDDRAAASPRFEHREPVRRQARTDALEVGHERRVVVNARNVVLQDAVEVGRDWRPDANGIHGKPTTLELPQRLVQA